MEANRRQNIPPLAPDLAGVGRCRSEHTRTCSASSSLTVDHSKRGFLQDENATPGWSTEWTEEKHNLHLNFLEASFVKQLHKSMGLLAWCSQERTWDPNSCQHFPANTRNSSHQFTVLRDGHSQKINSERNNYVLDTTADSHAILESPWICHFRPGGKHHTVTYPDVQEHCTRCGEVTHRSGRKNLSCGVATRSEQLTVCHLCHRVSVGSITEVSDQNFIDEGQREKSINVSGAKRLKTDAADASSKDQVVPF